MSRLSPLNRQYRGAVRINPKNPEAVAMCDGCGFWVMSSELRQQYDFRGGWTPEPTGIFVCKTCNDVPQPYYQRQVLPPDPVPLANPRPDPNVTLPTYGYVLASQLTATAGWIDVPFPPASTTSTGGFTYASQLATQAIWS